MRDPAYWIEQIYNQLLQLTGSGTPGNPDEVNITQYGSAATTLGQKADAASVPVTLSTTQVGYLQDISAQTLATADSVDQIDTTTGQVADAAVSTDANGTISAKLRGIIVNLISLLARFPATLGQKVMASSFAVTIASDQSALVVEHRYSYARAAADTQVKASAGLVHTVNIAPTGTVTAGVLTIYDNTAESGTIIYSISLPITTFVPFAIPLDVSFATGLYVGFDGTLANVQATVSYR